jgi:hypothetical protein
MATSMTADSPVQERVFAYLTDPATHPLVRRIDTHVASVFLEGDRALKVKRAVHFPYLDYSTLAKRKAACDEEMKINRQFAPQIYRRVVPITQRKDGTLDIGGDGTPADAHRNWRVVRNRKIRFGARPRAQCRAAAGCCDIADRCVARDALNFGIIETLLMVTLTIGAAVIVVAWKARRGF